MRSFIIVIILMLCTVVQMLAQVRPRSALVVKDAQIQSQIVSDIGLDESSKQKKSVLVAVIASLILPGAGEWYVGPLGAGKYHLIAESGLWITYLGFRVHSSWLRQDAQVFAKQHAGADFNKKDDQYAVNIGNFNTTEEYNEAKGRNREYELIYLTNANPDYLWNWDSDMNRQHFKDLRIRSDQVKNDAKLILGAIVVNHLISAFSAGRKAAAHNKSISMIDNMQVYAYTQYLGPNINGIGLSVITKF